MHHQSIKEGNVFILQHTTFQNVVRFGCSEMHAEEFADQLNNKTRIPGKFIVYSSIYCEQPCSIKDRVTDALRNNQYVDEFYQITAESALNIVKRETMRIPLKQI